MGIVQYVKECSAKEKLIGISFLLNLAAVAILGYLTWTATGQANSINRGQNTLNLIVDLTSPSVREARDAIYGLRTNAADYDLRDFNVQNELIRDKFAPFLRQVDLIAFCLDADICDAKLVKDYTCPSLVSIFSLLDDKLKRLNPLPSAQNPQRTALINQCQTNNG
ncbi:MAG: hypothetical protein AAFO73_11390 [Pseudomonadota bacterium]